MKSEAEVKFIGDVYSDNYTCGLTMLGSDTMSGFEADLDTEDETVLRNKDDILLRAKNNKSDNSDAIIVETSIENHGDREVVMELMTSVLLKKIKADKIYRLLYSRISSLISGDGFTRIRSLYSLAKPASLFLPDC